MITEKISIKNTEFGSRSAIKVSGLGKYSLRDTLECGQCFRHELIFSDESYVEYLIPIRTKLIKVGQQKLGELLFFDVSDDDELKELIIPYFTLLSDYEEIKRDIISRTDSD